MTGCGIISNGLIDPCARNVHTIEQEANMDSVKKTCIKRRLLSLMSKSHKNKLQSVFFSKNESRVLQTE